MASAYDSGVTKFALSAGLTTCTTNAFTISGSDRVLYVGVFTGTGAGSTTPSSVKWGGSGGVSLTQIGTAIQLSSYVRMTAWRLIAPATGSNTVYVAWAAAHDQVAVIAASYTGVDQTTPERNTLFNEPTALPSSPFTANTASGITTVVGDLVVNFVGIDTHNATGNAQLTPTAPATSRGEIEGTQLGYESMGCADQVATTTTTTPQWTGTGTPTTNFQHAWVLLDLIPTASAPDDTPRGIIVPAGQLVSIVRASNY